MSTLNGKLSRRDFLKAAGLSAATVTAGLLLPGGARTVYGSEPAAAEAVGMLIDLTRCTGCESCALACKQANGLPHPDVAPRALSSSAYTFLDRRTATAADGTPVTQYVKRQCMHCLHPACVSACTVGALSKKPEGPVVYDATKCFGCRYCQYACPFGVPTYEWQNPIGLIHKCQFCANRLKEGQNPACVDHCPTGALRFGKRDDLLSQARAQIASNPGHYVDQIYGEKEVGGTSVLYLSRIPFTAIGFPILGSDIAPRYAETVMNLTPFTALTVAAIATGGYLWAGRRGKKLEHVAVATTPETTHGGLK